jgi:hypothetical protein
MPNITFSYTQEHKPNSVFSKAINHIKDQLTDRITYVDMTGRIINHGDICLIPEFKGPINKKHLINCGNIAMFIRLSNKKESKLVFGAGKNKFKVFTFFDKKTINNIKINFITLPCIIGDYKNMDPEWKKVMRFDEAINAANIFLANINK